MSRPDGKFLKHIWKEETPTGTIDGANTSFTLSETPLEADSLTVIVNGIVRLKTTDYSLSGTTLTMTWAPAISSTLWVSYIQKVGE